MCRKTVDGLVGGKMIFLLLALLQTPQPEVLKSYNCSGISGGRSYETVLTVSEREKNFLFNWNDGNQGMGFRTDNKLAVVFLTPKGGLGVVLYTITHGRMEGLWAGGDGQIYPETCISGLLA